MIRIAQIRVPADQVGRFLSGQLQQTEVLDQVAYPQLGQPVLAGKAIG